MVDLRAVGKKLGYLPVLHGNVTKMVREWDEIREKTDIESFGKNVRATVIYRRGIAFVKALFGNPHGRRLRSIAATARLGLWASQIKHDPVKTQDWVGY